MITKYIGDIEVWDVPLLYVYLSNLDRSGVYQILVTITGAYAGQHNVTGGKHIAFEGSRRR